MRTSAVLLLLCVHFLSAQRPSPYANENARPSAPWVTNAVIYEIYPRAFSPEGNFAGIQKKLPELKKLGVTVLWLMPIHPVGLEKRKGSLGSSYSIADYYGINPEYGTLDDFKKLLNAAHAQGLKLVIDLVANHTSWDSKMLRTHPEWFTHDSTGAIVAPVADWSDVADLNYDNAELRSYMIAMMKYWVKEVGIDGFRCDVAEMVPTDFWEAARATLDSVKPVMMLAEGQYPEHHVKAFDLTYSWNLYGDLGPILDGKKSATEIDTLLAREAAAYPKGSLRLRFSSNHDENAWDKPDVVKFGVPGAKLAAVLVNTMPGVPLLYNGQEAGSPVALGLFEKFNIDWKADATFRPFYEKLYALRRTHPSLVSGNYASVKSNQPDRVIAFVRSSGKDRLLMLMNTANEAVTTSVTLPAGFEGKSLTDLLSGNKVEMKSGTIVLPAKAAFILIAR